MLRREVVLPASPQAPMLARQALNAAIPPPELLDRSEDIRVAISEIVSNAVLHARLRTPDVVRLVIEADDDHVRVEVEQRTDAAGVRPVTPGIVDGRAGGYGLGIVEQLADHWGTDPGPPGLVWFDFLPHPD